MEQLIMDLVISIVLPIVGLITVSLLAGYIINNMESLIK